MFFTQKDAEAAAKAIGLDFSAEKFTVDDLLAGMNAELRHGTKAGSANVTNDDPTMTAKLAISNLRVSPSYYSQRVGKSAWERSLAKGVQHRGVRTEFKTIEFALEDYDEEEGTFSGYGAVFSNIDSGGDIIEPGAFRFICNGEQVLHLEIALGYQHRGVERTMTTDDNVLRQTLVAESVAGDSAVAHATSYAQLREKLADRKEAPATLDRERAIALELERMAMHIADTGALCMDVGYQLGQVACEALRTVTINTTQAWCGNRFGKGLIRPFGTNHPLTDMTIDLVRRNIADVRRRYDEVRHDIKSSPSLLSRFEQCGIVPRSEMTRIGGVGPAARASGVGRDLRTSHPWGVYGVEIAHEPFVKQQGDVMARLMMRCRETLQSADYVLRLLDACDPATPLPSPDYAPASRPDALAFGLVEGWRGEICHVALTDAQGALRGYKIKDPSLHNWLALALAVRGEGISDFPICNKSFNLSYCGHDL